jgi:hypothetical protein
MSLSRHPQVVEVVNGNTFVQQVRLSCTVLTATTFTDEVIRKTALTQAYPRIALILATSVDKDKASILPAGGISYEILYREVERLATSQPYVDDIHRVAASLTAAYFIRSTPLNSSIQLLPLGDRMEQQAIEDLDRLRGQVLQQIRILLEAPGNTPTSTSPTFYFSGLIESGRSSDQILIPEGMRGIAVYTITTSQPVPVELVVEVPPLIPDLLTSLSTAINNLSIRGDSNVLASPNRGAYVVATTDCVEGGALVRLDYITLSPRRVDPIITRELAILSFYLIPDSIPIADWKANVLESSIPSLLYGLVASYQQLHPSGPHSLLVELDKGELVKVDPSDAVDTLYIQGVGDGIAKYSITIDGATHEGVIPLSTITGNSITSQVAQSLREVLGSYALVGELGSQAVQVIPNGTSNISVGLVALPPGISTSVGTAKSPLYPYTTGSVALTVNPNSGRSIRRPTMAEEATGVYSATSFRMLTSPRMQAVYDKLDRMDRLRGRCNGRW